MLCRLLQVVCSLFVKGQACTRASANPCSHLQVCGRQHCPFYERCAHEVQVAMHRLRLPAPAAACTPNRYKRLYVCCRDCSSDHWQTIHLSAKVEGCSISKHLSLVV